MVVMSTVTCSKEKFAVFWIYLLELDEKMMNSCVVNMKVQTAA